MQALYMEQNDESNTSGSKFVVDCSTLIEKDGTTSAWLDNITRLMTISPSKATGMSPQGVLGRRKKVVIKITDAEEDIENEWTCSLNLRTHANFLRYFCFFRCNDVEEALVGQAGIGLCRGKEGPPSMQVLVMEHVEGGSMKNFVWSAHPVHVLQDFILQSIFALLEAHVSHGFRHGDFHLDNVLVAKTARKTLAFPRLEIETHGLLAKLMDFELSEVGRNRATFFFKDLQEFFGKSLSNLALLVTAAPLQECLIRVRDWAEQGEEDPQKIVDLVPVIRTLRPIAPSNGIKGGGCHDGPKKKKPRPPNIRRRRREEP